MPTIRARGRWRERLLSRIAGDKVKREKRFLTEEEAIAEERARISSLRDKELDKIGKLEESAQLDKIVKERRRLEFERSRRGKVLRTLREVQKEIRRPREAVLRLREERDRALGRFRGDIVGRRKWAEAKEKARKTWAKQWSKGEDNRFTGRHAPKWNATGDWGRPKRRKRRKKRKPWWERKGLWD